MDFKVAIICCSNGYGHTKRALLIDEQLKRKKILMTIFAPREYVEKLSIALGTSNHQVVDFYTANPQLTWPKGKYDEWTEALPSLDNFDLVISDNHVEILKIRKDAWLSGSFLWHRVLPNIPKEIYNCSENLLKINNPHMLSTGFFSCDYLRELVNLHEVGLYSKFDIDSVKIKKTDLLISCGIGSNDKISKELSIFLENISLLSKVQFRYVWVEPALMPKNSPNWMIPATFSKEMYSSLLCAIVRPGVGTITDLMASKAKVFAYFECNSEMLHNAKKLKHFNLGERALSYEDGWRMAVNFLESSDQIKEYQKNISLIDFNGAKEAADLIELHLMR